MRRSVLFGIMFLAGRSTAFVAQTPWTKVGVAVPSGAVRMLQSTSSKADTYAGRRIRKAAGPRFEVQRMKKDEHQPPLINLYTIKKEDLQDIVVAWGYPKYRADQVYHWVREKGIVDVEDMKNLPKKLKEQIAMFSSSGLKNTEVKPEISRFDNEGSKMKNTGGSLEIVKEQTSRDGTIKRLYRLRDGLLIESVLMVYEDGRRTACISSQAGCAQGCVFCATGQQGFSRQLTSDEIVEQVTRFSTLLKSTPVVEAGGNEKKTKHNKQQRLSNIVFMGEGEPLANFRNVMEAVPRIQELAGIGARKITISTVGVVPNIRKLMDSPIQVRLAVSLHCASDEERSALLPANRRYGGLNELMTTLKEYVDTTGRRITLEWALIQGENDTPEVARQLGNLLEKYKLRRDMVHINVIPLNPTGGYSGSASGKKRVDEFRRVLEEEFGITCTPRMRRGIDIDAGCGQLKAKELSREEDEKENTKKESNCSTFVVPGQGFSLDSATLDLDSDLALGDDDDEIMDETFDPAEAARLISLVQGTTVKEPDDWN